MQHAVYVFDVNRTVTSLPHQCTLNPNYTTNFFFFNLQSRNSAYSKSSVSCLFRSVVVCKIWGSHNSVKDSRSTGTWLPLLWRNIVPLSSGPSSLSSCTTWPWRWKNYNHPECW